MRQTGLHLRLNSSFSDIVEQARMLDLPIFQCFFISQETHERVQISDTEVARFLRDDRARFSALYLHGSYWINLASVRSSQHRAFFRERELAERLSFTHMVVHPGAATGGKNKLEGIESLARFLNTVTPSPIKLILENGIHGGMSVGGDLNDFRLLLEKLDFPDRIFFCIDTAHAYSYGYDLKTKETRKSFIDQMDNLIGLERIVLIHLNDTRERLGSKIDRHEVPGKGNIGLEALRDFVSDKRLKDINIVLELPQLQPEDEREVFEMIKSW